MSTQSECIGLVGVGIMGAAIATRLLECGQQLTVFDLDATKVAQIVAKGAAAANSPQAVAAAADFVILSLNSAQIVRQAVFGPQGIAVAAGAEKLLIDMSSIDPEATKAMATELALGTGMCWVDCPLSGGAPGALAGKLTVMAGGTAEDFERARAVMRHLTANYTLMGPCGAGQATKLVNQVLCAITFQAIAEATALAERGGVAAERIPQALAGGRADSRILQEFMAKMARRDYSPTGRLDNMLKDLDAVQAFARATTTPMPVTGLVTEIHRMFVAGGLGGEDNCALMRQFEGPKASS